MSTLGYVPYKPKPYGEKVLHAVTQICVEYKAWDSPLTVRQIFYRLVAEYQYEKTEAAYGSLVNYIARSRRAFQARIFDEIIGNGLDAHERPTRPPSKTTLWSPSTGSAPRRATGACLGSTRTPTTCSPR
jgi:hypothetical protein